MSEKKPWYSAVVVRKEPLLCDLSHLPAEKPAIGKHPLLKSQRENPAGFPVLNETQVIRHFSRLSRLNYAWEDGLYPLGSCTMKYNPVLNEKLASSPVFARLHPSMPAKMVQGALQINYEVQEMIRLLLDMPAVSLQPAAGAHGELAGVFMMKAYFNDLKQNRRVILIPDSAHGTNPASAAMAGYEVRKVSSTPEGLTDLDALRAAIDDNVAALMITNPNTLGVFEKDVLEIKKILDSVGALLYVDGANLNAVLGKVSFSKMGVDLTQLNLHKTFSTPHGGGGPGQGALGVSERMLPYLPSPHVRKTASGAYEYYSASQSIGPMKGWYSQFANVVRAWTYIKTYGQEISQVADRAVLNANYLRENLKEFLQLASPLPSMHEVVFTQKTLQDLGATTMNLAKALLDRGFYAPTVYFPLHVNGAIMVEPTETESREEMDVFIGAIADIFATLQTNPDEIKQSPRRTFVRKIDDVGAARKPVLTWHGAI